MFVTVFVLFGIGMATMLNPAPSGGLMGDIAGLFGESAAPSVPTSLLARPSAVDAAAPPTALTSACPSIDLRLLVIAADESDTVLPAIRQTLDYLGTPYVVWLARERPGELTPDRLASGCHSYYQGVILSTGELVYADETGAQITALTEAEWEALRAFEATFGLRQLSWYTFPTTANGFQLPEAIDTGDAPIDARFTDAGRTVFASVNTARSLTIANAYTYLAYPAPDAAVLPLMVDEAGHALVAIQTAADGRENLVLTFDSNQNLPHTLAVAYDLVPMKTWFHPGLLGCVRFERHPIPEPLQGPD